MALEFNADKEKIKSSNLEIQNDTTLQVSIGGDADKRTALYSKTTDVEGDKLIRVGINTRDPQYELDVEGQIRTTTSIISDTARINNLDIDTIVNPELILKAPILSTLPVDLIFLVRSIILPPAPFNCSSPVPVGIEVSVLLLTLKL